MQGKKSDGNILHIITKFTMRGGRLLKRKSSDKVYILHKPFEDMFVKWCKEKGYTYKIGEIVLATQMKENGGDITSPHAIHHYRNYDSEIGRFNYRALQRVFGDVSHLLKNNEEE